MHRWFGAYGVTKSALDHLMMLAADELGPSWVRVNGIRPGLIRTDLVQVIIDSPRSARDYRQCTPLPRIGEVTDVANLAMFLLSDAASWITGQIINVDGGLDCVAARTCRRCWHPFSGPTASAAWSERACVRNRRSRDSGRNRCGTIRARRGSNMSTC